MRLKKWIKLSQNSSKVRWCNSLKVKIKYAPSAKGMKPTSRGYTLIGWRLSRFLIRIWGRASSTMISKTTTSKISTSTFQTRTRSITSFCRTSIREKRPYLLWRPRFPVTSLTLTPSWTHSLRGLSRVRIRRRFWIRTRRSWRRPARWRQWPTWTKVNQHFIPRPMVTWVKPSSWIPPDPTSKKPYKPLQLKTKDLKELAITVGTRISSVWILSSAGLVRNSEKDLWTIITASRCFRMFWIYNRDKRYDTI